MEQVSGDNSDTMATTENQSRLSIKRIAYTLRRKVTDIKAYTSREGMPGHVLKTQGTDTLSPASTIGWTEGDNKKLYAQAEIPGDITFTVEQGAVVFTAPESGASIRYFSDGSFQYAASLDSPLSARERLRREQRNLDWWDREPEIMKDEYITETGVVDAAPDGGAGKKGTPFRHFKLSVPFSETETKAFDVYAYDKGIGLVDRRKLQAGDPVRLRASVQYHEQNKVGGGVDRVPWLRLFDVRKVR